MKKILGFSFVLFLLYSCTSGREEQKNDNVGKTDSVLSKDEEESSLEKLAGIMSSDTSLIDVARNAVAELSSKKLPSAACMKQPLLFSPTTFLSKKTARVLSDSAALSDFFTDKTKYTWGRYDGSGEPIKLTNEEYYGKFIYDKDFLKADEVVANKFLGGGNTKNNVNEIYPNAHTVDFHFKGTEKNNRMDWSTLRLVFEKYEGKYCLVAIVHDQWSI